MYPTERMEGPTTFLIKLNNTKVKVHNDTVVMLFLSVYHPEDAIFFDYTGGPDFSGLKT